ncbi:MAG: segregation and condensation protein A [Gammaproteobacteria bacterium]|nr:segregation and condensation protein A [Gammaproteobacteria bacterium]
MNTKYHSKEHQILSTVRQVLSAVARETAPRPGHLAPLSAQTIDDLKHCFMLITAREKEIIEAADGDAMDARPRYADEPKTSQVVEFTSPKNKD